MDYLLEIMLESMLLAERREFLSENQGNKGNGYHLGHTYGHSRRLEFRIPRDHYGNFHPQILAILRDQGKPFYLFERSLVVGGSLFGRVRFFVRLQ